MQKIKLMILMPFLLIPLIMGHLFYKNQEIHNGVMFSVKVGRIGIFSQQIYYIEDVNDVRKRILNHFQSGSALSIDPNVIKNEQTAMNFDEVLVTSGRKSDTLFVFLNNIDIKNAEKILKYSLNSSKNLVQRHNEIISRFDLDSKDEMYTPTIISDTPRLITYKKFNSYPQMMLLSFVLGLLLYSIFLMSSRKSDLK